MLSPLVLVNVLAVSTHAFTQSAPGPIRWGAIPGSFYVVAPQGFPYRASVRDQALPTRLTIQRDLAKVSPKQIPYFVVNPDNTITWEARGLCIEASNDKSGDAVLLNHCNGSPTQLWTLLTLGSGTEAQNQIQLKDTGKCIESGNDVSGVDEKGGFREAPVQLRDCVLYKMTQFWKFQDPVPLQAQSPSQQRSFSMRHAMIGAISMLLLGALTLRARGWRWSKKANAMAASQDWMPISADNGGLSMTRELPLIASMARSKSSIQMPSVMSVSVLDRSMARSKSSPTTLQKSHGGGGPPRGGSDGGGHGRGGGGSGGGGGGDGWCPRRIGFLNKVQAAELLEKWDGQTRILRMLESNMDPDVACAHTKGIEILEALANIEPAAPGCICLGCEYIIALISMESEPETLAIAGAKCGLSGNGRLMMTLTHLAVRPVDSYLKSYWMAQDIIHGLEMLGEATGLLICSSQMVVTGKESNR